MTLQIPSLRSAFPLPCGHETVEIQKVSNCSHSPVILKCQMHWCSGLLHFYPSWGSWASWSLCRCTLSVWLMAGNMWHLSPALEIQSSSFGTGIQTLKSTSLLGNQMLSQCSSIPVTLRPPPPTRQLMKSWCKIPLFFKLWSDKDFLVHNRMGLPALFHLVLLIIYPKSKSTQKVY